jgi:hypothetical protein
MIIKSSYGKKLRQGFDVQMGTSLFLLWSRPDNFYLSRLRLYSKEVNMLRKEGHWLRDIVRYFWSESLSS